MSIAFHIASRPDSVVFVISGRITQEEDTSEILAALTALPEKKPPFVLFDISGLEYITSSGLNFFIRSLTRIRNAGGELILCGLSGPVEKLFRISKLNEIFTICPDLEEGLAKVNAQ